MKIDLGFNNKRYSRDMSFDNNTTYGFGEVQPNMCQLMLPNSDIKVNARQFVRLSPMKVPSFGRVRLETVSRFVPMSEIYEPFESFLSHIPYSTGAQSFIPSSAPNIFNNMLVLALLPFCTFSRWHSVDGKSYSLEPVADISSASVSLYSILLGFSPTNVSSCYGLSLDPSFQKSDKSSAVSLDSADFVITLSLGSSSSSSKANEYVLALRLNGKGQRLRKIFLGLGYDLFNNNGYSHMRVTLLPILAFYKAYFETYYPQRYISFTNTKCFRLIEFLKGLPNPSFVDKDSVFGGTLSFYELWAKFVKEELCQCWYASQDDYMSIHTVKPLNNVHTETLKVISGALGYDADKNVFRTAQPTDVTNRFSLADYNPDNPSTGAGSSYPILGNGDNSAKPLTNLPQLDSIILNSLRIFSHYVAKDSVIGQRMSAWVRQHFNADLANRLFEESNFVGRSSFNLNLGDAVYAMADTAQGSGSNATGENLGSYAGHGEGAGALKFKFHSKYHGYFLVFSCIVPDSRTFQGTDSSLCVYNRYDWPTPEFDALGYEITDGRSFIGSNDMFLGYGDSRPVSDSFGYVPRYTRFKYRKNIVNGDMSRRSTIATMSPYYLDRIFNVNEFKDGKFVFHSVPPASPEWRFITRYGFLSNFNRLFYNEDSDFSVSTVPSSDGNTVDNFLGQATFSVILTDCLKPLKSSYDTVDEDDHNVKSVESV